MTLFCVGVVEMAIAASWTRFVSKSNVVMNGVITYINIFIWYYVIDQVVNYIHDWRAMVPYAAGCAIGSMIGGTEPKILRRFAKNCLRKAGLLKSSRSRKIASTKIRVPAEL